MLMPNNPYDDPQEGYDDNEQLLEQNVSIWSIANLWSMIMHNELRIRNES
uniref:Uncharacterized protein n=1 Tax=Arundo donax TaxID=35708 RepID=A0A0A9C6P2_ARUDO